jgi:hypothetical protein
MSQSIMNQGFPNYFCLVIEGSGTGSGSIPLTNGSGSRRPKNIWIRWIQIRIRNTGSHYPCCHQGDAFKKFGTLPS